MRPYIVLSSSLVSLRENTEKPSGASLREAPSEALSQRESSLRELPYGNLSSRDLFLKRP
jgi:hypothetical protein